MGTVTKDVIVWLGWIGRCLPHDFHALLLHFPRLPLLHLTLSLGLLSREIYKQCKRCRFFSYINVVIVKPKP